MTRRRCATCAHWEKPSTREETGKCQLPPPRPGLWGEGNVLSDWPETKPTDGCERYAATPLTSEADR